MKTITLLGAGGKMGCRIADNLRKTDWDVRYVEVSERGRAALAERGLEVQPAEQALAGSDAVILALPDNRIRQVTAALDPQFRPGTMLIALDIAAPLAGDLPNRADLTWFVTHPCHPSVFGGETDPVAQQDFFGGIAAKQNIVCSLVQGPEEEYAAGEQIAREIYAPVGDSHRCTAEQMAILEPVLSETVLGTCLTIVGEAMQEAVRRGVPEAAARDFLLGHLKVELGIVFRLFPGATFSDGALKAIDDAKRSLFQPDWKKVFEREQWMESIRRITAPPAQ
ncbi:MAG TPA: phosphogluconate dehydrogenase C-terminal domain-containing protein [Bryobacteraceae bacterium]|nr:phosphogluconate dehydrogenase C-terminal domain-containing protein [Bryobacteraceae bacterium]